MKALDPSREHAVKVERKDSDIVVTVHANQTVLAALRAANVDIESDCEEGLCGSCEVRVLAGKVDHRDVVLTSPEREANDKMMTCCSRACGTRLVLELFVVCCLLFVGYGAKTLSPHNPHKLAARLSNLI